MELFLDLTQRYSAWRFRAILDRYIVWGGGHGKRASFWKKPAHWSRASTHNSLARTACQIFTLEWIGEDGFFEDWKHPFYVLSYSVASLSPSSLCIQR